MYSIFPSMREKMAFKLGYFHTKEEEDRCLPHMGGGKNAICTYFLGWFFTKILWIKRKELKKKCWKDVPKHILAR